MAVLERRPAPGQAVAPGDLGPASGSPSGGEHSPAENGLLLAAVTATVLAACLPFTRVFDGPGFIRPVVAAVLLPIGLSWAARLLRLGAASALGVAVLGWAAFVAVTFLPDTLAGGVVPTTSTLEGVRDLWLRGLEVLYGRPAPLPADAGVVFLVVTGVWAVAHASESLVLRLRAPLRALALTTVLWSVPLTATSSSRPWAWALPYLLSAAALLLAVGVADVRRWGHWSHRHDRQGTGRLVPAGVAVGVAAIVAGVLLAGTLPGYGEPPWYDLARTTGPTLTENPIVSIRRSLVNPSSTPVLRTRASRPVYLRVTSLDLYSASEEWTNAGIRGRRLRGRVPFERPIADATIVRADVRVDALPGAVLVPAPYQAMEVWGPVAERLQYDERLSTFTVDRGVHLQPGDEYSTIAAVPAPDPAHAPDLIERLPGHHLTELPRAGPEPHRLRARGDAVLKGTPRNVPDVVVALARDIVAAAGASTPFEEALAIQNELRSWTYSLDVPPGHSGSAMEAFIRDRVGYCEQYAGTMAVMLRALDIPARVGVGFTPGQLVERPGDQAVLDPVTGEALTEYIVTHENAHAWVEVLTREHGWIVFEPTPRSDGNVLVPTAGDLAPQHLAADRPGMGADQLPDAEDLPDEPASSFPEEPARPEAPEHGATPSRAGIAVGLVALLLSVFAGGVALWSRRADAARSPAERVLRARAHVDRLGRGVGVVPRAWETDREFLDRLSGSVVSVDGAGQLARRSADTLTRWSQEARYGLTVDDEAALQSELAVGALEEAVLGDLPAPRRALARVRGPVTVALEEVAGAIRAVVLRAPGLNDSAGNDARTERQVDKARAMISARRRSGARPRSS
jgi:transglutaminase-like putative cysteine protease